VALAPLQIVRSYDGLGAWRALALAVLESAVLDLQSHHPQDRERARRFLETELWTSL
jgi:hypothetical protein